MSTQNTDQPVTPEEFRSMAASINKIHVAANEMMKSGLSKDAFIVLLHHQTRVPQRDIKAVLDGLSGFGTRFLTPEYLKVIKK